ncbi:MAG: citrate synthase, partial [bacterium]
MNETVFKKLGRTPSYDTALKLEAYLATHPRFGAAPTLREQKFPNVDFYSGIVYQKMGIPVDLYTPLFAMSRVAGWLAHYMEQVDSKKNKIFRPKQNYDGARDRKV